MVRQTKPAFRYPAGKQWGPYDELANAQARKAALQKLGSDGKIVFSPAPPCALRRPDIEWET
jgi:hypothetical protein